MKKKIAIFTGNRAEYGLLYSVIEQVSQSNLLHLQLIVSGAHLDKTFGNTIDLIQEDGFNIADQVLIDLKHDDLFSTALAIGDGIKAVAHCLKKLSPDLLVVYADRFEGFAAIVAATQMGIPVAHVEGGDMTEGGALDDSVRHAMTKLSHLHFTTNLKAYRNILQLGEEAWRVHNIGLPSLDLIYRGRYANEQELKDRFNLDSSRPIILFTQHSVTTEFDRAQMQIQKSLPVLEKFLKNGATVFITYPNNDAGGRLIISEILGFKDRYKDNPNLIVTPSLGANSYHGILALARQELYKVCCVGNSSSGIKETPIFGCPTVNIGTRQQGRLRAQNLIDVSYDSQEIENAILKCFDDHDFRNQCTHTDNPYGEGNAGVIMCRQLENINWGPELLRKKTLFFY